MTDLKLGELAAQERVRDDVKTFGQMMETDMTVVATQKKPQRIG